MVYNTAMFAEILSIGSELTKGTTVNTNAAYLSRRLAEAGFSCNRHTAVSDEPDALKEAIRESVKRCSLLITTGGLGPTFDDITVAVLAKSLGRRRCLSPIAARTIRKFYAKRSFTLQQAALRQALIPRGAIALPNPIGTAPGIWLKTPRCLIVALPGVPPEMRAIMNLSVMPRLKKLNQKKAILGKTLRTIGLVELQIQSILEKIDIPSALEVGLYPSSRMVDVRLTATASTKARAEGLLRPVITRLKKELGTAVYGTGQATIESVIGKLLLKKRSAVSIAESCTGGQILERLTQVPGSSAYLRGGVVAYHNDLKRKALGVRIALLKQHGAVSAPVALAMAAGVRKLCKADIGLSVTGIAGPGGGTKEKPIGLVFIGLSAGKETWVQRHQFSGDRQSIRTQAAQTALNWLRCYLLA